MRRCSEVIDIPTADPNADDACKPRPLAPRRRLLYSGVAVVVTAAFLLLLAEGAGQVFLGFRYGWRIGAKPEREQMYAYDPLLGWRVKKNHHSLNRFGEGKHVTHNSQGFRATSDYAPDVPRGRYRIICLGDSFTHGTVGDADTFPAQLEALWPTVEVVNMGGGGYGIDQAYLWYKRDGNLLHANLLLFAFIEDDLLRAASNTFRTRYPKPQLVLEGDVLAIKNVPVPTWGVASTSGWIDEFPKRTALFQILRKTRTKRVGDLDVFPIAERIVVDLKELSQERNQKLILVYLPVRKDLTTSQATVVPRWAESVAKDHQIAFVNLTHAFKALPTSEVALHFTPDGHYSERGNLLVAMTLLGELTEKLAELPR
jgi:hypothetical protein